MGRPGTPDDMVGTVVYLAVMGTCVTFGLYFWALRHAPAASPRQRAELDLALTRSLVRFAHDTRFGQVRPSRCTPSAGAFQSRTGAVMSRRARVGC